MSLAKTGSATILFAFVALFADPAVAASCPLHVADVAPRSVPKNVAADLAGKGYRLVDSPKRADFLVRNLESGADRDDRFTAEVVANANGASARIFSDVERSAAEPTFFSAVVARIPACASLAMALSGATAYEDVPRDPENSI